MSFMAMFFRNHNFMTSYIFCGFEILCVFQYFCKILMNSVDNLLHYCSDYRYLMHSLEVLYVKYSTNTPENIFKRLILHTLWRESRRFFAYAVFYGTKDQRKIYYSNTSCRSFNTEPVTGTEVSLLCQCLCTNLATELQK